MHYQVVSIIGAQSTGKSTLMNQLFQTSFQELNSQIERKQTTQGVWLEVKQNLLIVDVEGSDSMNRQTDQNFEKFVDLFALSISDIILINIWVTDIGRFSSSQLQLLETILRHQIKIWGQQYRKHILFVLRDFTPEKENFAAIQKQLEFDIKKTWEKITTTLKFSEIFDLTIYPIPHLIYCKEEFTRSVLQLRQYINTINLKNLTIPLQSFDLYCAQIWKIITTQQDLNLPNTRVLISQFRCQEFIEQSISEILKQKQLDYQKSKLQIQQLCNRFQEQFTEYDQVIVNEKYQQLKQQIQQIFYRSAIQFFEGEKNKIYGNIKNKLEKFVTQLTYDDRSVGNINLIAKESVQQLQQSLNLVCTVLTNEELIEFNRQFELQLNVFLNSYKSTLIFQFKTQLNDSMQLQLKTSFDKIMADFSPNLLSQCDEAIVQLKSQSNTSITNFCIQLNIENSQSVKSQLLQEIDAQTRIVYNQILSKFQHYAEQKFTNIFTLDSQGFRNQWYKMSESTIRKLYISSLETVGNTVEQVNLFSLKEQEEIMRCIKKGSEKQLEEALLINHYKKSSPYWFWIVLVIIYLIYDRIIGPYVGIIGTFMLFGIVIVTFLQNGKFQEIMISSIGKLVYSAYSFCCK